MEIVVLWENDMFFHEVSESFVQRSKKLRVLAMSQFLSYKGDIFDTTVTFSKILEAAADADIGCSY